MQRNIFLFRNLGWINYHFHKSFTPQPLIIQITCPLILISPLFPTFVLYIFYTIHNESLATIVKNAMEHSHLVLLHPMKLFFFIWRLPNLLFYFICLNNDKKYLKRKLIDQIFFFLYMIMFGIFFLIIIIIFKWVSKKEKKRK